MPSLLPSNSWLPHVPLGSPNAGPACYTCTVLSLSSMSIPPKVTSFSPLILPVTKRGQGGAVTRLALLMSRHIPITAPVTLNCVLACLSAKLDCKPPGDRGTDSRLCPRPHRRHIHGAFSRGQASCISPRKPRIWPVREAPLFLELGRTGSRHGEVNLSGADPPAGSQAADPPTALSR